MYVNLFKHQILIFLLCLSTFKTTPIALIKTNSEVEPALINGNPVDGIEPVNMSYCTNKIKNQK